VTTLFIPWDRLAPARRLFLAHLRGDAAAAALFGRGGDEAAMVTAVEERRDRPLPHRAALVAAMESHLRSLDAPAASVDAARRLAHPRAVIVIAGQQPAPLGGPLLSFAKALGVIALAARLEARTGTPVVPVWWVASEDHDRAEAGTVVVEGGLHGRDLMGADDGSRRMLSRVAARSAGAPSGLPVAEGAGGFADAWAPVTFLARDGESVGSETARLFLELLGPRGLVVVEPSTIHPFARAVFERDVMEPAVLAAAVREGNAAVRAAGFEAVLADPVGPLHFRIDDEGARTRGGGMESDLAQIGERLSADVSLRVLSQNAALPVAVQVAGPTEAEYLAALRPAHRALGLFHPAIAARPGVTILEPRVEAALQEFGVSLEDLYLRGAVALDGSPAAVEDPLASLADAQLTALTAAAGDPQVLNAAVRRRLAAAAKALEDLGASVRRAAEERRGVGERARRRVLDALLPDGVPQERRWALPPWLLRHGPDLLRTMADACADPRPGHHVLRPRFAGGS
jgi:uncharacterized protein YllA (UPF0747 family)